MGKPIEQPKVIAKVQYQNGLEYMTKSCQYHITQFPIKVLEMIEVLHWLKEKLQNVSRKIPIYPDATYRPPP